MLCQYNGIADGAQLPEIDAFHDAAAVDVEADNYPSHQHGLAS
jgi:hypothetical protein